MVELKVIRRVIREILEKGGGGSVRSVRTSAALSFAAVETGVLIGLSRRQAFEIITNTKLATDLAAVVITAGRTPNEWMTRLIYCPGGRGKKKILVDHSRPSPALARW